MSDGYDWYFRRQSSQPQDGTNRVSKAPAPRMDRDRVMSLSLNTFLILVVLSDFMILNYSSLNKSA